MPCRCCPGGISRSTRVPRYPSDMSDTEWAVIEPALPAPAWMLGKGGRPAEHCRRDIVDGIRYLVKEGIQWRAMPADFPHWRTVYDYTDGWQKTGATEGMHDELRRQCRIAAGRKPEPTAAVIDSQSVSFLHPEFPQGGGWFDRSGLGSLCWFRGIFERFPDTAAARVPLLRAGNDRFRHAARTTANGSCSM